MRTEMIPPALPERLVGVRADPIGSLDPRTEAPANAAVAGGMRARRLLI